MATASVDRRGDRRRHGLGRAASPPTATSSRAPRRRSSAKIAGPARVPRRQRGLARAARARSSRASRAPTTRPRSPRRAPTAARAEAQLAQAQRDLERARSAAQQGVISRRRARERADARRRARRRSSTSARAQRRGSPRRTSRTRSVRAPFDGTVLRKDAEVGEIVAPSSAGGGLTRTAIVTMADLATLEVEVDVNEAYIAQIRERPAGAHHARRLPRHVVPRRACARSCRPPTARRRRCWSRSRSSTATRASCPRWAPRWCSCREAATPRGRGAAARAACRAAAVGRDGAAARACGWSRTDRCAARTVEVGPRDAATGSRCERGSSGGETRRARRRPPALKDGAQVRVAQRR